MPKLSITLIFFLLLISFPIKTRASQTVVINEILADPGDGQKEFVELYFSDGYFDVSSHTLKDKAGTVKTLTTVEVCQNFAVYELATSSGEGWLNNSGEESVFLLDANNSQLDAYENWTNPGEGKSLGRVPDGASWQETQLTRCAANQQAPASPTPTPTTSTSQTSTSKSPSPTPAKTTSSTTTKSPSPTSAKQTSVKPEVLSEKTASNIGESINLIKESPNPSPSPEVKTSNSKTKVAGILVGSGVILIGLSMAAYLWYRRKLINSPDEAKDL